MAGAVRESVKLRTLPADQLIDQKLTKLAWALNESVGKPQGRSVHLTQRGIDTVFENIQILAELDLSATLAKRSTQDLQNWVGMHGDKDNDVSRQVKAELERRLSAGDKPVSGPAPEPFGPIDEVPPTPFTPTPAPAPTPAPWQVETPPAGLGR